ncbi:hypothetical protein PIB30_047840 [Stylosanthes scabra]|uniref:Uncharacterized protein n=1 Tax=Stylosanthes scabra TaxID=79078 RepID=A0ABU6RGX5_9FABA|nr:hypothetical protein [Stylosanthes scabra]
MFSLPSRADPQGSSLSNTPPSLVSPRSIFRITSPSPHTSPPPFSKVVEYVKFGSSAVAFPACGGVTDNRYFHGDVSVPSSYGSVNGSGRSHSEKQTPITSPSNTLPNSKVQKDKPTRMSSLLGNSHNLHRLQLRRSQYYLTKNNLDKDSDPLLAHGVASSASAPPDPVVSLFATILVIFVRRQLCNLRRRPPFSTRSQSSVQLSSDLETSPLFSRVTPYSLELDPEDPSQRAQVAFFKFKQTVPTVEAQAQKRWRRVGEDAVAGRSFERE